MKMNIETKAILNFLPSACEVTAMGRTDTIIGMLQEKLYEKEKVMALATGEIITYDDLCRVRGVLGGLMDNCQWEIIPTEEK